MDAVRAAHLAREALALWGVQRLADAAKRYEEAIACADPEHFETGGYHRQLACVLAALGRDADALDEFRTALEIEQSQGEDDASSAVALARYFLAEHHAKVGEPSAGLEVLKPSLVPECRIEGLLRLVQAECLWQLGHIEEARAAAQRAMHRAASARQRERMRERLAKVLDGLPES